MEVEHWMGKGAYRLPTPTKLRMPSLETLGVGPREISSVDERETTRTAS
jgi:hypothetical protein